VSTQRTRSRAVSIGGLFRKWKTAGRGSGKQPIGLLAIGSALAFFVTLSFLRIATEITVTLEEISRTLPTLTAIYLGSFVALASGAAASLALIASPRIISRTRHELLDVMIGGIAVSLIPPAAVVGIGLIFGRFDVAIQSLALLLIYLVCLNVFSVPVLYYRGVGLEPLRIEKKIRARATVGSSRTFKEQSIYHTSTKHVFKNRR
jgi:uncharacterized membrane protein